jgi:glycosyltransferase involved in cell wall biosynthesis
MRQPEQNSHNVPNNGRMHALHVVAGNLYGGVERIIVEIARARTDWRHQFAVCFDGRLLSELLATSAECYRLGEVRFSRPHTTWRARRRLRQLCRNQSYEVVLCHSPWSYALAAGVVDGRRVLWAHDALDGTHWTERTLMRLPPDLMVCNSQYTARAIENWLPRCRREVIYAPVAIDPSAATARAEVRRDLGAGEGTTVILIAARLERWKGQGVLLEVASELCGDWVLWIAGGVQRESEAQFDRELKSFARDAGIFERVRFLGERRDVGRLLCAADVYCQPNTQPEPFGVSFVEALSAGVPVVTTNSGGAREIVDENCGVLVPSADRAALRNALQLLIDVPCRRRALGAAGPHRARLLCDPDRQISRLERVLAPIREQVPV